ncbi:MAG TPA: hypothetical protein VGC40_01375 [Paenirhodobacter sp.]
MSRIAHLHPTEKQTIVSMGCGACCMPVAIFKNLAVIFAETVQKNHASLGFGHIDDLFWPTEAQMDRLCPLGRKTVSRTVFCPSKSHESLREDDRRVLSGIA